MKAVQMMADKSIHDHMVSEFRKRFWVSLSLTIPILVLSPLIRQLLGLSRLVRFPGDRYVLFGFSSLVFFYGGYPFLKGLATELHSKGCKIRSDRAIGNITKVERHRNQN